MQLAVPVLVKMQVAVSVICCFRASYWMTKQRSALRRLMELHLSRRPVESLLEHRGCQPFLGHRPCSLGLSTIGNKQSKGQMGTLVTILRMPVSSAGIHRLQVLQDPYRGMPFGSRFHNLQATPVLKPELQMRVTLFITKFQTAAVALRAHPRSVMSVNERQAASI